ncbi:hypothetical protein RR46_04128 [Papilio xuthus]|uniref:DUF4776 domain-containing protein n=1 Tax=Papilio xuthus TaxID=66420 RepID=A0A194QHM8_PAPXU|nr:hypothetical protein RR46_04128 [Papilio xuthus]
MSVTNAMFIFEVVVQSVKNMTNSTELVIRSDFADIFSLELKDPKQMHIVMPEPLPLPPEPPGKKKKKEKKPKGKKKGAVEAPPPEPVIQSGQSVLFSSSPEVLTQNMKGCPMQISLWNKEDYTTCIGSVSIPWDSQFLKYLELLYKCQDAPPVTLNEEYNIFEEGTAKLIAKLGIQVKLSYLGDKVTSAFRTLSEDPVIKKVLYTGMNSKTTSYICTMKTTDEVFEENCNKVENNYIIDKPRPPHMIFADYKNAPGARFTFTDGDYCCMGHADKPPNSPHKAPETCPDIDFIIEYVRKIITSCYDNMRMLTPRPTIKPRIKATDIDRLCYCKETNWPQNELSSRFKKEVQKDPCPLCRTPGARDAKPTGKVAATFDIANIRGPCGRHDCKIARGVRAYIENLIEEDNKEIKIDDIIGPCGSKECTLAERIQQFLRQEGVFKEINNVEGLSTQCACIEQMQNAFVNKKPPKASGSDDSSTSDSEGACKKKGCPFGDKPNTTQVYNVYYFFVKYDKSGSGTSSPPDTSTNKSSKFEYCTSECPSIKATEKTSCSKSACTFSSTKDSNKNPTTKSVCDSLSQTIQPSPDDSNVVMDFDEIKNPCCVKSCNVVETVKDFIVQGARSEKKICVTEDPCYCDCICNFNFSNKTTYCAVCGGYECIGEDVKQLPEFLQPHPCPVYNKLYDKHFIKVPSPWPDEDAQKAQDTLSIKSTKGGDTKTSEKKMRGTKSGIHESKSDQMGSDRSFRSSHKMKSSKALTKSKAKKKKEEEKPNKIIPKIEKQPSPVEKPPEVKYPFPPVPKNMGWLWTAEDVPGLKFRPKWRPGAANKILVRRYRAIREGVDIIAKKKRALLQRKKKMEMKPTLVVKKKNGDYTVQMEVFKKYSKERLIFQYPYDEKPPLIYTIGKTEEEKAKIQKQRERRERRETRRKCRLLQSTFRNRCQEICLKAYNQAIGLLPLPEPNNPECPCYTDTVKPLSPQIDSCSCSDEGSITSSDTDNDDWVIEFTPPLARWDPKVKHPPVLMDNESQYNYLDYKVKLLDRNGNPVPRYFKGPDGKQECSDLGGFWGPKHVWLEINKDGYIGPDNRWVPMNFTGPDGMFYSSEEGFFTDNTGRTLRIGIDGYIEKDGKWAWYSIRKLPKSVKSKTMSTTETASSKLAKEKLESKKHGKAKPEPVKKPNSPKAHEKKVASSAMAKGGKEKPKKVGIRGKGNSPVVMSVSVDRVQRKLMQQDDVEYAMDQARLERYNEIMEQIYNEGLELRLPSKTNRACNTSKKRLSPLRIPNKMVQRTRSVRSIGNGESVTTTGSEYHFAK